MATSTGSRPSGTRSSRELASSIEQEFLAQLRADGRLSGIVARAREKRARLENHGLLEPRLDDAAIDEAALWKWYFEQHLRSPVPASLDGYAECHGVDLDRLRRAVLREYCYTQIVERTRLT